MKFLTKGDNNQVDDRGLYAPNQLWLQKKDVVGRARGFVPVQSIFFGLRGLIKVVPIHTCLICGH